MDIGGGPDAQAALGWEMHHQTAEGLEKAGESLSTSWHTSRYYYSTLKVAIAPLFMLHAGWRGVPLASIRYMYFDYDPISKPDSILLTSSRLRIPLHPNGSRTITPPLFPSSSRTGLAIFHRMLLYLYPSVNPCYPGTSNLSDFSVLPPSTPTTTGSFHSPPFWATLH